MSVDEVGRVRALLPAAGPGLPGVAVMTVAEELVDVPQEAISSVPTGLIAERCIQPSVTSWRRLTGH